MSPVPLTATATENHVLAATTYSKSTLRAVAGDLYQNFENIDYFPSYEIVINPWVKNNQYEENLRSVNANTVDQVMKIFLNAHDNKTDIHESKKSSVVQPINSKDFTEPDNTVCEEMVLELQRRGS